jgi:hypothetical protein
MLGGPIGLFLISHLVFPENLAGSDLRSFYYEKMNPILWIAVLTVIASATLRPIVLGTELFTLDNLSTFLLIPIFLSLTRTKNAVFHGLMVVLILIALLADILLVNMVIQ